jgi:hypothetical protein
MRRSVNQFKKAVVQRHSDQNTGYAEQAKTKATLNKSAANWENVPSRHKMQTVSKHGIRHVKTI